MKVREATLRLKRFEAEEKSQKVVSLEQMIREFEQMALDLERQVNAEEERTGIRDTSHFAYSTFARSAAQRRSNLVVSIADLQAKLEAAQRERDEILEDIGEADLINRRDDERSRDNLNDAEALAAG